MTDGDEKRTGLDFAVLELSAPISSIKTVSLSRNYEPLQKVYAFGYPAIVIEDDPDLIPALLGDRKALPAIVSTTGEIKSIKKNDRNVEVIASGARISGGNSGGPLFNDCGHVIGINTCSKAKKRKSVDFALSGKEIINFLSRRSVAFSEVTGACR